MAEGSALVPRRAPGAQFHSMFIHLPREHSQDIVGLWCRKCYGLVTLDGHGSLTEAGYVHLLAHERSAALTRLKSLNQPIKEDSDENAIRPRYRPLRYHRHG
jgi:hypothetical protein